MADAVLGDFPLLGGGEAYTTVDGRYTSIGGLVPGIAVSPIAVSPIAASPRRTGLAGFSGTLGTSGTKGYLGELANYSPTVSYSDVADLRRENLELRDAVAELTEQVGRLNATLGTPSALSLFAHPPSTMSATSEPSLVGQIGEATRQQADHRRRLEVLERRTGIALQADVSTTSVSASPYDRLVTRDELEAARLRTAEEIQQVRAAIEETGERIDLVEDELDAISDVGRPTTPVLEVVAAPAVDVPGSAQSSLSEGSQVAQDATVPPVSEVAGALAQRASFVMESLSDVVVAGTPIWVGIGALLALAGLIYSFATVAVDPGGFQADWPGDMFPYGVALRVGLVAGCVTILMLCRRSLVEMHGRSVFVPPRAS